VVASLLVLGGIDLALALAFRLFRDKSGVPGDATATLEEAPLVGVAA
jgi:hypothetical protein